MSQTRGTGPRLRCQPRERLRCQPRETPAPQNSPGPDSQNPRPATQISATTLSDLSQIDPPGRTIHPTSQPDSQPQPSRTSLRLTQPDITTTLRTRSAISTFGLPGVTFWVNFRPIWGHFLGQLSVNLGPLSGSLSGSILGQLLGQLWGRFWVNFWVNFGVDSGSLFGQLWGRFWVTFRSLFRFWGQKIQFQNVDLCTKIAPITLGFCNFDLRRSLFF